jgi:hypothetical protein
MSFKSMDLMIDVLPTGKFTALLQPPGLGLCTIGTATTGNDEDDDEGQDDDGLGCVQGTAPTTNPNEPESASRKGMNLSLLRRQLHAALSPEA